MQVFELADELGVRNADVLQLADAHGLSLESGADELTDEQVARLRNAHEFEIAASAQLSAPDPAHPPGHPAGAMPGFADAAAGYGTAPGHPGGPSGYPIHPGHPGGPPGYPGGPPGDLTGVAGYPGGSPGHPIGAPGYPVAAPGHAAPPGLPGYPAGPPSYPPDPPGPAGPPGSGVQLGYLAAPPGATGPAGHMAPPGYQTGPPAYGPGPAWPGSVPPQPQPEPQPHSILLAPGQAPPPGYVIEGAPRQMRSQGTHPLIKSSLWYLLGGHFVPCVGPFLMIRAYQLAGQGRLHVQWSRGRYSGEGVGQAVQIYCWIYLGLVILAIIVIYGGANAAVPPPTSVP